jgi:hypothetical protein
MTEDSPGPGSDGIEQANPAATTVSQDDDRRQWARRFRRRIVSWLVFAVKAVALLFVAIAFIFILAVLLDDFPSEPKTNSSASFRY